MMNENKNRGSRPNISRSGANRTSGTAGGRTKGSQFEGSTGVSKKRAPAPSKRRKRFSFSAGQTALLMGAALIAGTMLSSGFARPKFSSDYFTNINLFGRIYEEVHENYVTKPEDQKLIKGAVDGMLSTLDPHSNYLTSDDFKTMQEQTAGSFAGLGIQVVMPNEGPDKGYVLIVAPIDDSPAAAAGLKTNDIIVEIDGEAVQGKTIDEAIALMKGKRGTKINIQVVRDREEPPMDINLVRDIVRVNPVIARAEGDFGYVRVATFSQQAAKSVQEGIDEINKEIPGGMKGLVLDLRSNPGGLLDQSVKMADLFLDGGEIVSTRGRRPRDTLRELGTRGEQLEGKPIVVLINGGSASASEIVAGALQDRNRALLLGTKSFGKGSVQTVIPLQNGLQGALRLTTARYYTPSGRSIQAQGIDPDIDFPVIYEGQDENAPRRSEADLPGALDVKKEIVSTEETSAEAAASDDDANQSKSSQSESSQSKSSEENAGGSNETKDVVASAEEAETLVEPFLCLPSEEEPDEVRDCQLEKALEILADTTQYSQALAQAATVKR